MYINTQKTSSIFPYIGRRTKTFYITWRIKLISYVRSPCRIWYFYYFYFYFFLFWKISPISYVLKLLFFVCSILTLSLSPETLKFCWSVLFYLSGSDIPYLYTQYNNILCVLTCSKIRAHKKKKETRRKRTNTPSEVKREVKTHRNTRPYAYIVFLCRQNKPKIIIIVIIVTI